MIGDLTLVTCRNGQERVHHLRYNNAAIYRLTRETKIGDPMVYFQELYQGKAIPIPSQADIVDLLWAGLLHKNRGATIDVALALFDELPGATSIDKGNGVFPDLVRAIFKAMGQEIETAAEPAGNVEGLEQSIGTSSKDSVPDSSGSVTTSS